MSCAFPIETRELQKQPLRLYNIYHNNLSHTILANYDFFFLFSLTIDIYIFVFLFFCNHLDRFSFNDFHTFFISIYFVSFYICVCVCCY